MLTQDLLWEDKVTGEVLGNQFAIVQNVAGRLNWGNDNTDSVAQMLQKAKPFAMAQPDLQSGPQTPFTLTVAKAVLGPEAPIGSIDMEIGVTVRVLDLHIPNTKGGNPQWKTNDSKKTVALTIERPDETFVTTMTRIRRLQAYSPKNVVWCVVSARKEREEWYDQQGIVFIHAPYVA